MPHHHAGHLQIAPKYDKILQKLDDLAVVTGLDQELPLRDTLAEWQGLGQGILDSFQGYLRHLLRFPRRQVAEAGGKLHLIHHAPVVQRRAGEVDHAQHELDPIVVHEYWSQVGIGQQSLQHAIDLLDQPPHPLLGIRAKRLQDRLSLAQLVRRRRGLLSDYHAISQVRQLFLDLSLVFSGRLGGSLSLLGLRWRISSVTLTVFAAGGSFRGLGLLLCRPRHVTHADVTLNLGLGILLCICGAAFPRRFLLVGSTFLQVTVQELVLDLLATAHRAHYFQNEQDGLNPLLF